jgi:hypothetical protein
VTEKHNIDFSNDFSQPGVDDGYAKELVELLTEISAKGIQNQDPDVCTSHLDCNVSINKVRNVISNTEDLGDALYKVQKVLKAIKCLLKYRGYMYAEDDMQCYELMEKISAFYAGVSIYELRFISDVYSRERASHNLDLSPTNLLYKLIE